MILYSSWLNFMKYFTVEFQCTFNMKSYPFDDQTCHAKIGIDNPGKFVQLMTDKMHYLGQSNIMQYMIIDEQYFLEDDLIIVKIVLGRNILNVILTTILPSLFVMIVALSTNFYHEEHFKTIIPVNTTALLLMVTLFVGVSARLPQTSYIKMIDVWLLFTLVIPFTNIFIHGYLDYTRKQIKSMDKSEVKVIGWTSEKNDVTRNTQKLSDLQWKIRLIEQILRILVPLFSTLFVISFMAIGFVLKQSF